MTGWLTDPLTYGFTLRALAELALLGAVGGTIGCWIILYRISYSAESLAHGMLPGLVLASLLGFPLILGGAVGVILAGLLVTLVARFTPGEPDTAIAVAVTALFGLGVLMALFPAAPVGIQGLLFGDPLGVDPAGLVTTTVIGGAVLLALWRGHHRLLAAGFDRAGSPAVGLSPARTQGLLLTLVAVTVLIGVQGLGTLLVAAILIAPAAAARLLTDRLPAMIAVSGGLAIVGGLAGIYLSWYARIAAGAAVVICLVGLYLAAACISTLARRGRRSLPPGPAPLPSPEEATS